MLVTENTGEHVDYSQISSFQEMSLYYCESCTLCKFEYNTGETQVIYHVKAHLQTKEFVVDVHKGLS